MARYIAFEEEATYGTVPANVTKGVEAESESLQLEREFERITTTNSAAILAVNALSERVAGDVVLAGSYEDPGLLLTHFFGSRDDAGASPYTHTFPDPAAGLVDRPAGVAGASLSCEVRRTDEDALTFRYSGLKVVGWSFNFSSDASPKHTFSFIGKGHSRGTASTGVATPTYVPQIVQDASFSFDGGTTTLDITSASVTASWPVDEPNIIGQTAFAKEPRDSGPLAITGEVTALIDVADVGQWDAFDGTTVEDVRLLFNASASAQLQLDLSAVRVVSAVSVLEGRNRQTVTYGWEAYDPAQIAVTLINNQATV